MPHPSYSQVSDYFYRGDALRRLVAKGRRPITQADLDAEVAAMQTEAAAQQEEASIQHRLAQLESDHGARIQRLEQERRSRGGGS